MPRDRLSILLPIDSLIEVDGNSQVVSHMQIKKNDETQRYELRFFDKEKLILKKEYHNMTLNVISGNQKRLSLHISENGKINSIKIIFVTVKDVLRIKKYVDTLLI